MKKLICKKALKKLSLDNRKELLKSVDTLAKQAFYMRDCEQHYVLAQMITQLATSIHKKDK